MRILHLVPGTGNFHSGVCLRDHALARELRLAGHEVEMVPLYLPLILDHPEPNLRSLQIGGVDLYFQQHSALFRRLPRWSQQLLDTKPILRAASACMSMTRARDLGVMTVGSFECLGGPQRQGWRSLLDDLKREPRPDVISISLGLLAGLGRFIKEEIGCRVVVSLQGEDVFLDHLPEPWREQAWRHLAGAGAYVDQFIAPSAYYAERMHSRLGFSPGKISVVHNGAGDAAFQAAETDHPPIVGFLARQCHGKGLDLLVDAFIALKLRGAHPDLRLKIGGSMTGVDRKFVKMQQRKLQTAGLIDAADFHPNMTFAEKISFLQSLSVMSVPTRYPEAFGLYAVEAMACGVPLVQPAHGAFPELIHASGAGTLFEPDDTSALADALDQQLLADEGGSDLANRAQQRFMMRDVADAVVSNA